MLSGVFHQINRAKFLLNDHSTTILTGVGVGGTIATAVLTGRASFKAAELIAQENAVVNLAVEENVDPVTLSKTEKVKLVWQVYLPPVASGVLTIASIIVANKISSKKIAALAVAGGISERALQEYKDKVVEKLGDRQSQKIQDEIQQDRVNNSKIDSQMVIIGTGEVLCYDGLTGRYFTSTVEKIKQAENQINFNLLRHMYCSLSEFYDAIGLAPTTYSDSVGWQSESGEVNVMFSTVMSPDGRPCVAIDFEKMPTPEYYKVYD